MWIRPSNAPSPRALAISAAPCCGGQVPNTASARRTLLTMGRSCAPTPSATSAPGLHARLLVLQKNAELLSGFDPDTGDRSGSAIRVFAIPHEMAATADGGPRRLRVWSAACSTGEEAYSIAMTLLDGLDAAENWDVRILASDIDTDVLERGSAGVYPLEAVTNLPRTIVHRHFHRGVGAREGLVRVRPEVAQAYVDKGGQ